jgi:hypothetical protein
MATVPNAPAPLTQERMIDGEFRKQLLLAYRTVSDETCICVHARSCSSEARQHSWRAPLLFGCRRLAGRFSLPSPAHIWWMPAKIILLVRPLLPRAGDARARCAGACACLPGYGGYLGTFCTSGSCSRACGPRRVCTLARTYTTYLRAYCRGCRWSASYSVSVHQ